MDATQDRGQHADYRATRTATDSRSAPPTSMVWMFWVRRSKWGIHGRGIDVWDVDYGRLSREVKQGCKSWP